MLLRIGHHGPENGIELGPLFGIKTVHVFDLISGFTERGGEVSLDIEEGREIAGDTIAIESGARYTTQELRNKYPGKIISGVSDWSSQAMTISEPVKTIKLIKRPT